MITRNILVFAPMLSLLTFDNSKKVTKISGGVLLDKIIWY